MKDEKSKFNLRLRWYQFFAIIETSIFQYLKSKGYINWSWWVIYSPVLIPMLFACVVAILFYFIKRNETAIQKRYLSIKNKKSQNGNNLHS